MPLSLDVVLLLLSLNLFSTVCSVHATVSFLSHSSHHRARKVVHRREKHEGTADCFPYFTGSYRPYCCNPYDPMRLYPMSHSSLSLTISRHRLRILGRPLTALVSLLVAAECHSTSTPYSHIFVHKFGCLLTVSALLSLPGHGREGQADGRHPQRPRPRYDCTTVFHTRNNPTRHTHHTYHAHTPCLLTLIHQAFDSPPLHSLSPPDVTFLPLSPRLTGVMGADPIKENSIRVIDLGGNRGARGLASNGVTGGSLVDQVRDAAVLDAVLDRSTYLLSAAEPAVGASCLWNCLRGSHSTVPHTVGVHAAAA